MGLQAFFLLYETILVVREHGYVVRFLTLDFFIFFRNKLIAIKPSYAIQSEAGRVTSIA